MFQTTNHYVCLCIYIYTYIHILVEIRCFIKLNISETCGYVGDSPSTYHHSSDITVRSFFFEIPPDICHQYINLYIYKSSGQIIIIHEPESCGHLGMIPLTKYDYSEGEQWGRYEIYPYIYIYINLYNSTMVFILTWEIWSLYSCCITIFPMSLYLDGLPRESVP